MTDGNGRNGGPGAGEVPGVGESDSRSVLDDELSSAATPILYILGSVAIAAGGYLLFAVLRG
jgi:hypothetical protein